MHAVITGATGFLGAFLLSELLDRGHSVTVLGRSSKEASLPDRLSGILGLTGADPGGRLSALDADFSKKRLGLAADAYKELCGSADVIIHCASDTSFAEKNRERVMESNVLNLSALLDFAADSEARNFVYISSAYACGVREGFCFEVPVAQESFTNVYEESKALAESTVTRKCGDCGIRLTVLRPSIVYGHSQTGKALKFNALYYAVKSLMYVRDIFIKDIERGGKKSAGRGFYQKADGGLYMPLGFYLPGEGTVNLIPVDYFAQTALNIIECPASEGIYHITSGSPPDMDTLIGYSERFLKIRGVSALREKKPVLNPAEELFDRLMEPYRPYLSDKRLFDRSRTDAIPKNNPAPELTYEVFSRCMSFAEANDWGKLSGFPK
ncbi:MAG: SDR family oxidoreductase [Bacillota bacterium]|nr:SDR family oxidoreductase [Bacillota bacterium]